MTYQCMDCATIQSEHQVTVQLEKGVGVEILD